MKELSATRIAKFNKIIRELEQYQNIEPSQNLRGKRYGIRSSQIGALVLLLMEKKII